MGAFDYRTLTKEQISAAAKISVAASKGEPLPDGGWVPLRAADLKFVASRTNGSFDGYYTEFARKLASSGARNPIVRIGWESNGISRPWFCGTDGGAFKATWQRIAGILRRYNPGVLTEWSNIKKGASFTNSMGYQNLRVDDLFAKSAIETDPAKRKAMMDEIQLILAEELPVIFLVEIAYSHLYNKRVHGLITNGISMYSNWDSVWVE